jgi:hypothetical protein
MRKKITLLSLAFVLFSAMQINAQDTIAAWTFPAGSADDVVDVSLPINSSRYISCEYGTWGASSFYELNISYIEGFEGTPDSCASASGMENGADSICWMLKFKTVGYHNLKLYSKQKADATNPGPADFKVQYKLSGWTEWLDLPNGTISCADDWTTGVLNGVSLPDTCNDLSINVSLRWLQTSNLDHNGSAVLASGISMIDDIIVTGDLIAGVERNKFTTINVYPNPSNGYFTIENDEEMLQVQIFDLLGKCVYTKNDLQEKQMQINGLETGVYFVHVTKTDNTVAVSKIVVN